MGRTVKEFARSLRRNQTDAEKILWRHLRSRRFLMLKFRRQQPMGAYILDFCSYEKKLVIELDGGQHADARVKDAARTAFLEKEGFEVIRVWNNDLFKNLEAVLDRILQKIGQTPLTPPSPTRGEGERKRINP